MLRIEDTDEVRSTEQSETDILNSLKWLGLDWDEGPGVGGDYGPYKQSERGDIYQSHIDLLLEQKDAFHCFCSPSRLDDLRKEQMLAKSDLGYDGHCLHLDAETVAQRIAAGEEHVIRMKVPTEGECTFDDLLRGSVSIAWSQVDMQVLIKSDGKPTYHFANVVDDHLMRISHVIRGEEWINSAPKHILLYQYFGWEVPVLCHMPLLRNPDKSKLSKRKNPTSIGYYQAMGYLPEAMLNYLGMMGWTMPSGEEVFTLGEMTAEFDIKRVSLGGPIFDTEKLDWLNGKYLREKLTDQEFAELFAAWAFSQEKVERIVPLLKQRVERFCDVAELGGFFLSGNPQLTPEQFEHKQVSAEEQVKILQFTLWSLEALPAWSREAIESSLQELARGMNYKIRDFLYPLFIAISGKAVSTSVIESIDILKLDISRARLRAAIDVLGGVSKKMAKKLEKEYREYS